ncbi:hypothetical protein ACJRO7_025147 [Eucalyptus globulus]|uniref:Uncharacterized protein n=1 Tax=Eucalyptus globulus TaxID=34317 RepID=A0ABD3KGJ5_EUCGL
MGQEEKNPKRSISSYGGIRTRSSKKQKQKKVPQRGLGVAQLDKIRIEEQQKSHATVAAVSTLTPPQDSDPDVSVLVKGTVPLASALKYDGLENTSLPQYDPPPSSTVNASTTSSSYVLNSQTEPPSNQSYHGNYAPIQQEEEKIGGLKRSCPLSSEKLPAFLVHLKLLTSANTPQTSDDSASSEYGAELICEPGIGSFRYFSDAKSVQSKKQNGVFSNEFLTLGLPTLPSTWPTTKSNRPFASVAFANCEPPNNEKPSCKGPRWVNQQGNYDYYSFLPLAKKHSDEGAASTTIFRNGVAEGSVDLDLKL